MNIIQRVTARYLKENRVRSLTTIIGIIISVAMITAVPTLVASFTQTIRETSILQTGNWHVSYRGVPAGQVGVITKDGNTVYYGFRKTLGFSPIEDPINRGQPFLVVAAMDKASLEMYGIKLIEGSLPENADEIVLSAAYRDRQGITQKIGDRLELQLGKRVMNAYGQQPERELSQEDEYINFTEEPPTERFEVQDIRQFKLVGIVEAPVLEQYPFPGYAAVTFLDRNTLNGNENLDVAVRWKTVDKAANRRANMIGSRLNLPDQQVVYNSELLRYYGIMGERNLTTLYLLVAIILVLILTGSITLIHNAFAISVVERSRQFGMLASVGATKAQKRTAIYSEAWLVGLIAIPLGLIFGTVGIGLTLRFLGPLVESLSSNAAPLKLVISPGAIITSAVLAIVMLIISAYMPARRASKVMPIEAIRLTKDVHLKAKDLKTSDLTRHMFGFEAELGLKNLKRNGKRYAAIILSLVISIVLFLGVAAISSYSTSSADSRVMDFKYPLRISIHSMKDVETVKSFFAEIQELDEVKDSATMEHCFLLGEIPADKINPEVITKEDFLEYLPNGNLKIAVLFDILSDPAYLDFLNEYNIQLPAEQVESNMPVVLVDSCILKNSGQPLRAALLTRGDNLRLLLNSDGKTDIDLGLVHVAGISPVDGLNEKRVDYSLQLRFIASESAFYSQVGFDNLEKLSGWMELGLQADDTQALQETAQKMQYQKGVGGLYYSDYNEMQRDSRNFRIFVNVFFYGFVGLITVVGAANIFNTIATSIAQRRQEFAMLRSVGMTEGGLRKMIRYESFFLGARALLFSIPIGVLINFLIYKAMSGSFGIGYRFPWIPLIIVILAVLGVVGLTMFSATKRATRDNIVETLKLETY